MTRPIGRAWAASRIVNTGSWIYEPLLVQDVTQPHPYWPGGEAILDDEAEQQPVGLLDAMAASAPH